MAQPLNSRIFVPRMVELDAAEVYEVHADYAWRSLHRLGVADADLPDLLQEVFIVVHRRAADYDPSRPLRAWLFGICVGLVRNYRRRAARDRRPTLDRFGAEPAMSPEDALQTRRQRERGRRLLDGLDLEKRAVFVMFEVEGMSGRAIAELLDVPLGTVHSRLHAARRELASGLAELGATEVMR